MLIEDISLAGSIILTDVAGLLQGNHAGHRVAIREILIMLGTARTLNKGDLGRDLAGFGKLFKLGVDNHVLQFAIAKMGIFGNVRRIPARGQDNSAEVLSGRICYHIRLQAEVRIFHLAF